MIFQYYSDTDMLYIQLTAGVSTESEEVSPGIVLDFGEHNQVIGIEVEDASKFVELSQLEVLALPITNLVFREMAPQGYGMVGMDMRSQPVRSWDLAAHDLAPVR